MFAPDYVVHFATELTILLHDTVMREHGGRIPVDEIIRRVIEFIHYYKKHFRPIWEDYHQEYIVDYDTRMTYVVLEWAYTFFPDILVPSSYNALYDLLRQYACVLPVYLYWN